MNNSMTCEQFENVLPQLLEDEAAAAALMPLARAHTSACAECRSLYDDLIAIRDQAAALPALVPSRDLWKGIAARIEAPVVPLVEGQLGELKVQRRLSWPAAAIAATVLIALSTTLTYRFVRPQPESTVVASAALPAGDLPSRTSSTPDTTPLMFTAPGSANVATLAAVEPPRAIARRRTAMIMASIEPGAAHPQPRRREAAKLVYDREITRLRAIVDSGRSRLDPATVAILDRNLRIIDLAIEQCEDALAKDSSSVFLIESLNNAYTTKVRVLRIAAAAASRG